MTTLPVPDVPRGDSGRVAAALVTRDVLITWAALRFGWPVEVTTRTPLGDLAAMWHLTRPKDSPSTPEGYTAI